MSRKHPELSDREQQLITLAAEGLTDMAIATRLGISEPTVKSYWQRVQSKLGPYNRTELVAHALQEESARVVAELRGEIETLRDALNHTERSAIDLQREMLENAPDAVFAVDFAGNFLWLNLEAERMFGYRYDELIGKPVSTLLPEDLRERHRQHMRQYFEIPERKRMGEHLATTAVRKDGQAFAIAASLAPVDTPDGRIVTCFVRQVLEEDAVAAYAERYGGKSS